MLKDHAEAARMFGADEGGVVTDIVYYATWAFLGGPPPPAPFPAWSHANSGIATPTKMTIQRISSPSRDRRGVVQVALLPKSIAIAMPLIDRAASDAR